MCNWKDAVMSDAATDAASASLWRNRAFLRLWLAQVVSSAGTSITNVALPLTAVLVLRASPAQMGLLGIAGSLPNVLFGPAAGVWVDRTQRRPILIGADLGRAALLGSIPAAAALGQVTFLHLWIVVFLSGSLTVFFQIASIALLPTLVTRAQLVEANSKLSISDSVVAIAGPGAAGGLVQVLGAPKALLADASSYLLSAWSLRGVRSQDGRRIGGKARVSVRREVMEGFSELVAAPLLRTLTITSSMGMLAGALEGAVLLLFLARQLELGPSSIGLVLACGGGGSLIGAALAGRTARTMGVGPAMILGKSLWAVGVLSLPAAGLLGPTLPFVVVGQLLTGVGAAMYMVNQVSLRQGITPVRLLGRVTAARRFVLFGAGAAGAALGGLLGGAIGLRETLIVGAAALGIELVLLIASPLRSVRA